MFERLSSTNYTWSILEYLDPNVDACVDVFVWVIETLNTEALQTIFYEVATKVYYLIVRKLISDEERAIV